MAKCDCGKFYYYCPKCKKVYCPGCEETGKDWNSCSDCGGRGRHASDADIKYGQS